MEISQDDMRLLYETMLLLAGHDPKLGYCESEGCAVAEALCTVAGPEDGLRLYDLFA